jgi:hypothetical protein
LEDPYRLACRTQEDGAVRIFDIRRLDKVEKTWHGIYNNHHKTGLEVSPDGNLLVTGKSFDRESDGGLVFLDIYDRLHDDEVMNQAASVLPAIPEIKYEGTAKIINDVYTDSEKLKNKYLPLENPAIEAEVNFDEIEKNMKNNQFCSISSGMEHTTAIHWSKKFNQIFAGTGASISVFFDRQKSEKGIIPALNKSKVKAKIGKSSIIYLTLRAN